MRNSSFRSLSVRSCLVVLPLALVAACFAPDDPRPPAARAKFPRAERALRADSISELLALIERSGASFDVIEDDRGSELDARQMADKLRRRYSDLGSPEWTTKEWIERVATRPGSNDMRYSMSLPDGRRTDLASWLRAHLE